MTTIDDPFRKQQALEKRQEGVQALQAGDVSRAVTSLSEAIALDPSEASAYLSRAEAYRSLRRTAEADADMVQHHALLAAQGHPITPATAATPGGVPTSAPPPQIEPVAGLTPTASTMPEPTPPPTSVEITVPYPPCLSRLLIFVKWAFAIPSYFWLSLHSIYASVVGFVGLAVTLFTGHYPRGMFEVSRGYLQHQFRVEAYFPLYLTDDWSAKEVTYRVDYPTKLSKLLVIGRLLLSPFIGILVIGSWAALWFVAFASWWGILFTGRMPRMLYDSTVALLKWQARISAWSANLRDDRALFRAPAPVWATVGTMSVITTGIMAIAFAGVFIVLSDVSQGQEVVESFLQDGKASDVTAAMALFDDSSSFNAGDVRRLFSNRSLFDDAVGTRRTAFDFEQINLTRTMALQGTIQYSRGPDGTFSASLKKSGGEWKLMSIIISRPPT